MSIDDKLKALGVRLNETPIGNRPLLPYTQVGSLLFISGNGPDWQGRTWSGRLGAEYTVEEGVEAARGCAYNLLSVANSALGSLERVRRIVKVTGFIHGVPGFAEPHLVLHGCSDTLTDILGEAGRHARSAITVAGLPRNWPVEVEMIVEAKEQGAP